MFEIISVRFTYFSFKIATRTIRAKILPTLNILPQHLRYFIAHNLTESKDRFFYEKCKFFKFRPEIPVRSTYNSNFTKIGSKQILIYVYRIRYGDVATLIL